MDKKSLVLGFVQVLPKVSAEGSQPEIRRTSGKKDSMRIFLKVLRS